MGTDISIFKEPENNHTKRITGGRGDAGKTKKIFPLFLSFFFLNPFCIYFPQ